MALIDQVLDVGRVIEHQASVNASLQRENQELRARGDPEVVAVAPRAWRKR